MKNPKAVVFAKGDYTCKTQNGTATVTVPRDVRINEVAFAMAKLFERRGNES